MTPSSVCCRAESPAGTFMGTADRGVRVWRGIPYALPASGERRFRAPVPAPDLAVETDATTFGPVCPQPVSPAITLGDDSVQDEDCLSLNVWAPSDERAVARPVMVWLHGGAYTFGASSQPLYDATSMVSTGDVVVVTLNYRVGALGFVDLSGVLPGGVFDGNLALRDVLLALRWVRRNIAAFGGDPDRVTVFGESAGGGLVTTLLATPSAEGLFHRAIAQSSPASSMYGLDRARRVATRFLELLSIDPADPGAADAIRAVPVDQVVEAGQTVYAEVPTTAPGTLAFAPVIDGDLLPEAPLTVLREGRGLPVPLMIGTNKDEASLFSFMKSPLIPITGDRLDQMFAAMAAESPGVELPSREQVLTAYEHLRDRAVGLGVARDIGFRLPTLWLAEGHSAVAPVWLYRFDHASPFLRLIGLGATHASELPYLWGNLAGGPKDFTFRLGGRRVAEEISVRMQARWVSFAHGDSPDATGSAAWPPFRCDGADPRETLVIDRRDRVVADLDRELREAWGDEVLSFR